MLIVALILFFTPFLLMVRTTDWYVRFSVGLSFSFVAWTGIALLLQLLGIFSFTTFLVCLLFILTVAAWLYYRHTKPIPRATLSLQKVAIIAIATLIVGYQFYAVHFSYTGAVNTLRGETYVTNDAYPYPLFSDEWIAVAVARESIEQQALPFTNPFTGQTYQNFLFVFHAFIAAVGVLVGGSLPFVYVWIGIVVSTVTALLFFVLLKSLHVPTAVSLLGTLLVPYVVNGSNLPVLWYLLPWNVGFVLLLCSFICVARKQYAGALLCTAASTAFYPPFIVLIVPATLVLAWQISKITFKRILMGLGIFALLAPILFIVLTALVTHLSINAAALHFVEILVRPLRSVLGVVPTFTPWDVLPASFLLVPLAVYGAWVSWKQTRHIVIMLILGAFIWVGNPLVHMTFFIDYHRAVAFTALLTVLMGMVGLGDMWSRYMRQRTQEKRYIVSIVCVASMLVIALVLVPRYTSRDVWRGYTTTYYSPLYGFQKDPAPIPVNRYITEDDIRIFSSIEPARFLAPGWKGLILGALTSHDPVFTKPSTITVSKVRYVDFLQATCEEKTRMLVDANVQYVYAEKVGCAGFVSVAESDEGLHLMHVVQP